MPGFKVAVRLRAGIRKLELTATVGFWGELGVELRFWRCCHPSMTTTLTKNDLCWVLVKLVGAFLVYSGVAAIYASIVSWWSLSEMFEGLPKRGQGAVWAPVKTLLFGSFLPLALGLRLLSSGTTLHGLLMRVPAGFVGKEVEITSGVELRTKENEAFKRWLKNNPEMEKRAAADRMALFRDAQKAGEAEVPDQ